MCPSEKQLSWATCNFPGNSGTGFQKFGFNGLFSTPRHPSVSYRSITDGATNTSIFSEWVIGPAAYVKDNPRRFVFATPAPPLLESNDFDAFVKLCRQMTSEDIRSDPAGKGKSWLRGDFKHTLYNHVISINGNSCTNSGFVRQGAWTAGSLHSQGANVVFVDGHSRFIKDSVALTVWRSLGSRNGGEAVSNDSF